MLVDSIFLDGIQTGTQLFKYVLRITIVAYIIAFQQPAKSACRPILPYPEEPKGSKHLLTIQASILVILT